MTKEQLFSQLVEFFRDSFSEDPAGVGDWIAQGDFTADEMVEAIDREFPKL